MFGLKSKENPNIEYFGKDNFLMLKHGFYWINVYDLEDMSDLRIKSKRHLGDMDEDSSQQGYYLLLCWFNAIVGVKREELPTLQKDFAELLVNVELPEKQEKIIINMFNGKVAERLQHFKAIDSKLDLIKTLRA